MPTIQHHSIDKPVCRGKSCICPKQLKCYKHFYLLTDPPDGVKKEAEITGMGEQVARNWASVLGVVWGTKQAPAGVASEIISHAGNNVQSLNTRKGNQK